MNIKYATVFVSDMKQATAFFRDVVGFPLRFETPGWTEFESGGETLALHATEVPALGVPAGQDPAGSVRFGFEVADLEVFHARMEGHGVVCVQAPKLQWVNLLAVGGWPCGAELTSGLRAPVAQLDRALVS